MGNKKSISKVVLPFGKFLGFLPMVKFFSVEGLAGSIASAGFEIDHQWQVDDDKAAFIVVKKAG